MLFSIQSVVLQLVEPDILETFYTQGDVSNLWILCIAVLLKEADSHCY